MKLIIERDTLLAALTRIAGVVSRRQTIAVLSHVLLEAGDGAVKLTTTNLDIQATVSAAAEVGVQGSTTIGAERLREICAKLPEGAQIEIDASDPLRAAVKAGRSRFSIGMLPAKDFPLLTPVDGGAVLEMEAGAMHRLFEVGSACMGDSGLACCYVEMANAQLCAVSTNQKCMTIAYAPAPKGFKLKDGVKIGVETVGVLVRALAAMASDAPAKLTILPGRMLGAELGGMSVISRVLDGDYAPYQRVIPAASKSTFTVDAAGFVAMLQRAMIASANVDIGLTADGMTVTARDLALGDSSEEEGESDWAGEERRLCVHAPHLLSVLALIRTESVVIQSDGPMLPLRVVETGEADWLGLCMPLVGSK